MSDTIQTSNLESSFQALRNNKPENIAKQDVPFHPDYKRIPYRNYAPIATSNTQMGNGNARFAGNGIIYGQPQFFSPVHTPINWQIPSKRLEEYQWARFFYSNEPKVAAALDFYSDFPMSDWTHECKNIKVKNYFDRFKKRLHLSKWMRLISHEVHLLGDCFPLVELDCPLCGGSGRIGDEICDHEGGTIGRIIILNPDFIEVITSPLSQHPIIALKPDEEMINMVRKKLPGYERLSPQVLKLISAGQSIRLDNNNVAHLKYGESPYRAFGIGMVRRLFPVLSYKTKLMVAQWVVAERLIIPIKIVKVGSDERPAGPADIAAVQEQLANTANDPNLTIVTHNNFELEFYGACHSADTEVLTENGWKLYLDVSKNFDEKIATYNLGTDSLEFDIPQQYHEYDFNGEMVSFQKEKVDVLVTPNHRMLISDGGKYRLEHAENLEKKSDVLFKIPNCELFNDSNDKSISKDCEVTVIQKDNISRVPYNGKVWCFTVKNGFFVTRRNGKIGIHGNSGKVLTLSNEFDFINQEILDGLMINNALLNGEGPNF